MTKPSSLRMALLLLFACVRVTGPQHTPSVSNFFPAAGITSDAFLNATYAISPESSAQAFAQYERHLIPSLATGAQHDESGWLQITWNPKLHVTR